MLLREFTSTTNDDGTEIVRVHARISDHSNPAEQQEWIEFQFSIEAQTIRNGAVLRKEALEKAHEILFQLAKNFEHIGYRNV